MKNLLDHLFNWITFFRRPVFSKSLRISDSHQTAIRQSISKRWTFESEITIDELNTSVFYPHNLVLRHHLLCSNSQVMSSVTFLIGQQYWRHSKGMRNELLSNLFSVLWFLVPMHIAPTGWQKSSALFLSVLSTTPLNVCNFKNSHMPLLDFVTLPGAMCKGLSFIFCGKNHQYVKKGVNVRWSDLCQSAKSFQPCSMLWPKIKQTKIAVTKIQLSPLITKQVGPKFITVASK